MDRAELNPRPSVHPPGASPASLGSWRSAAALVAVALLGLLGAAPSAPAATWTYSNTTPITIPDPAAPNTCGPSPECKSATPYPSSIQVATSGGTITDIDVTVTGFSHLLSQDVGIVLAGPPGMMGTRALAVMTGAGFDAADDVTLTFDDSAAAQLSNSVAITSGSWKPTNYEGGDFPNAPCPGTIYANPGPLGGGTDTFASTFNNKGPDGMWSLCVRDFISDNGADGSIAGGWSLRVVTSAPAEPTLTATDPSSPANNNNPRIIGSADPGTTVQLYNSCPVPVPSQLVATGTAEQLASPGIPVSVPDNSTTSFVALASESGVGSSNCSAPIAYTEQTPSDAIEPSNDFGFGKLRRNKKRGIAFLTALLPGPGQIGLRGKGIVGVGLSRATASRDVTAAGAVRLKIKPKGRTKKRLRDIGKAKVKVRVTYVPTGGFANTSTRRVKLLRR